LLAVKEFALESKRKESPVVKSKSCVPGILESGLVEGVKLEVYTAVPTTIRVFVIVPRNAGPSSEE
jgi:hypothetical protein